MLFIHLSIVELGYISLFLSSFLAATFVPIGSEVVFSAMILSGDYETTGCVLVASAGNWLGGILTYNLGAIGKIQWLERYLRISKYQIRKMRRRIHKYGSVLAFFVWLPIIGDPLAAGLGFFRVKWSLVFLWMLAGKFLRYLVLALILMEF